MPETSIVHGAQPINRGAFRRNRHGVPGHRFGQTGRCSVFDSGQHAYRVTTGEYARQTLLAVDDEGRSALMPPHGAARMLNRLIFCKQEWPLTFNDTRDLSKGCRHTCSLEYVRPKE